MNGTFDASFTGIAGLTVTVTNGIVSNSGSGWRVDTDNHTTFLFNQNVDLFAAHGATIPVQDTDGIISNGQITFTGSFTDALTLNTGSGFSSVTNNTTATSNGSTGTTLSWESLGATSITGTTTNQAGSNNGFSLSVAANSVPEPSTSLLAALAGLGFIARRRRA